jgi:hypothetical protein
MNRVVVPGGTTQSVHVDCPAGKKVLVGGHTTDDGGPITKRNAELDWISIFPPEPSGVLDRSSNPKKDSSL